VHTPSAKEEGPAELSSVFSHTHSFAARPVSGRHQIPVIQQSLVNERVENLNS
jgi:hypothetical protein